jgi:type IV pilus assembly protein PilY1
MNHSPQFSLSRLGAALACTAVLSASAGSDIDLFSGVSLVSAQKPNILIILDSSSNWNSSLTDNPCKVAGTAPANATSENPTMFAAEMCALHKVVGGLNDSVRLGLMMFAETGDNGGYVRYAVRDMTAQNKTAFQDMVAQFRRQGSGTDNSGSNQPYGKVMYEAFKYFGGYTSPANANNNVAGAPVDRTHFGPIAFAGGNTNASGSHRRDNPNCGGNATTATHDRCATKYNADANTAFGSNTTDTYIPPGSAAGCEKNFIIFISNGNPSVGGDSGTPDAPTLLANVGGNTTSIKSAGTEVHSNTMDEWARFLYQTDVSAAPGQQRVITYTIAVYPPGPPNTQDQSMIKLMKSAAAVGGGKYFAAQSADAVLQAILQIINEVQAVNSVFVSASLPVSVNTQGTFLNQVYMGMFRPDSTGSPRWLGNLKQYEFIFDAGTGNLFLGDAKGQQAVNPATGFITPAAESFWTTANTYWTNSPTGTPPSGSDLPDGEVVEKGGAAQKIRTAYATSPTAPMPYTWQTARRVYTCPPGGCAAGPLSLTFDNANIFGAGAQSAFGVASAAELAAVVNWVRGEDNVNGVPCDPLVSPCTWTSAENGPGWTTTVRPSAHGDVLHSRPVVLNYAGLGPYIFYGANDGMLHAVKGGQNPATDGGEVWAFLPPEFYAGLVTPGNYNKYTRLRSGIPVLKLPSTPAGILPTPQEKDYFFDGPIGSYQDFAANKAWIFVAARRGGRIIYAFDVSDPVNPVYMWKKTTADLPNLGQTWSEPKAIMVKASADPVLIFGGGYDIAEDAVPANPTTAGNRVYVLNAKTGALIREFTTTTNGGALVKSIPSDIATVDVDFDGFTDNAYVGDMGGRVYRLDLDDVNPANWNMHVLADLGASRKFFFQPDIVLGLSERTIVIGSGDREKPLATGSTDRFYGLRDTEMGKNVAASPLPIINEGQLVASGTPVAGGKGWYLAMLGGEKVVNSPLTIAGVTYFSTNQPQPPAPGTCSANLGIARAYALDFTSGTAGIDKNQDGTKNSSDLFTVLTGGGLPPSPVGGIVELDDGRKVGFIIGSGEGGSSIEGARVRITVPMVRRKVYWNVKTDK